MNDTAVDLSDLPETAEVPETIPVGIYPAVIADCVVKRGRDSGELYYNFRFRLTDPEMANAKPLYNIASFSPGARAITVRTLEEILGHPIERARYVLAEHTEDFMGLHVRLKVGMEEYQGRPKNTVERVMAMKPGSAGGKTAKPKKTGMF